MMELLLFIVCCGAFNSVRANVTADNTDNYSNLEDELDNQENVLTQVNLFIFFVLCFIF